MEVHDPVVAYIAADNLEAHLVCSVLAEAGIAAAVVEDISVVGAWIGGWASQLHKPQVCVGRADAELAAPVLQEYERRAAARRAAPADASAGGAAGEPVTVTCEECGKASTYPAAQRGSVQTCPQCHAH